MDKKLQVHKYNRQLILLPVADQAMTVRCYRNGKNATQKKASRMERKFHGKAEN